MTESNTLSSLAPFGAKLRAMQVICPPHPLGDGRKLRACMNKRGEWWYYQSTNGIPGPDDWIMHRKMNDEEVAEILQVDDKGQLQAHRGPSGCSLLFHTSELETHK